MYSFEEKIHQCITCSFQDLNLLSLWNFWKSSHYTMDSLFFSKMLNAIKLLINAHGYHVLDSAHYEEL